jgi:AcrR family transcriptional regulator
VTDKGQLVAEPGEGRRYRNQAPAERRAARRARLIDAAVEAFGTAGFRATSIEELCTAAGISTRNFYEEFSSREELVITLHDDLNARAFEAVIAALTDVDPSDLETRAHAALSAYFEVMTSDRRWARIALVESVGVSPAAEEHRRAAIGRFADLLALELDRLAGEGVIAQRDFSLTAIALVGAINGLMNTLAVQTDWRKRVAEAAAEAARLIVVVARA